MRVRIQKDRIVEVDLIFIERGESLETGKKFFYLEMKPTYSDHERLLYKYSDFRKNDYIDEYELLLDSLLEKGYLDLIKYGLEEIKID